MSGRAVHLVAAATIAAAASLFSITTASANCFGCGPSVAYQQPTVSYAAPVVYGYSYAAPVAYPAPVYSAGCGCAASAPMYVVNQGPTFNAPVIGEAEETPAYEPGYRRAYPYYSGGHVRWHRRHWYRGYGHHGYRGQGYRGQGYGGYGYRGYGYRDYGYRGHAPRLSYRGFGYRHGVVPGTRYSMRHPMVGGMQRGGMNRMRGPHHPMMGRGGMHHPMAGHGGMHRAPQHAGGMRPGSVHPLPVAAPKRAMP